MRRKDGLPPQRALRHKAIFNCGFKNSQNAAMNHYGQGNRPYKVTSLFSGCGGLDIGFKGGFSTLGRRFDNLPFDIVDAYDSLKDAVDCYRLNIDDRVKQEDLTKINLEDLPQSEILIGGFPCQDFSSSGPKTGLNGKRGKLYQVLLNYMRIHRPRIVVGENVIHLARMDGGRVLDTLDRGK